MSRTEVLAMECVDHDDMDQAHGDIHTLLAEIDRQAEALREARGILEQLRRRGVMALSMSGAEWPHDLSGGADRWLDKYGDDDTPK